MKTLDRIKGLAYYQIIGGILGFWILIKLLLRVEIFTGSLFVLVLFIISMYSYSIYCGILLLNDSKKGLKYSLINQLFQSIIFSIGSYYYLFSSGLLVLIGIDITKNINFLFRIKLSTFHLGLNTSDHNIYLGINVIALFIIYYIGEIEKKVEIEENELTWKK